MGKIVYSLVINLVLEWNILYELEFFKKVKILIVKWIFIWQD